MLMILSFSSSFSLTDSLQEAGSVGTKTIILTDELSAISAVRIGKEQNMDPLYGPGTCSCLFLKSLSLLTAENLHSDKKLVNLLPRVLRLTKHLLPSET